jgi:hypothetical protein
MNVGRAQHSESRSLIRCRSEIFAPGADGPRKIIIMNKILCLLSVHRVVNVKYARPIW